MKAPAAKMRGAGTRFCATQSLRRKGTLRSEPTSRMLVMPHSRKNRVFSTARSMASASLVSIPGGVSGMA